MEKKKINFSGLKKAMLPQEMKNVLGGGGYNAGWCYCRDGGIYRVEDCDDPNWCIYGICGGQFNYSGCESS